MQQNNPTLYKKTSTGKIQVWTVLTDGPTYCTVSGQNDGKKTTSTPTICKGKNLGKANATTDAEQALKEAYSKWEKKLKSGYTASYTDALDGKVDSNYISGGYNPMLAEKFHEMKHQVIYPCYGQPKLDGHRGTNDKGLFSRTRKPILSCPHILHDIEKAGLKFQPLDGELYNHDYKDEFEELSSAIRQSTPQEKCKIVQYHIYDLAIEDMPFSERIKMLVDFHQHAMEAGTTSLVFVPTEVIHSEQEAEARARYWISQGYEGYMLRNANSLYQGKRTADLQKLKLFQDAEFKIVGINDGKGKLAGHAATFTCEIDDELGKRTFKAKAKGPNAQLKEFWEDHSLWEGKLLTVNFINYTRKNVVPKHGVGLRLRDPNY